MTFPSLLETLAVTTTAVSVWLSVKKNPWLWPVGIIGIVAFFWIFIHLHLYSDSILQIIFLAQSIYGWYFWVHPKPGFTEVPVTKLGTRNRLLILVGTLVTTGIWGWYLATYTNDPLPLTDSAVAVYSVAAQWLLMRKKFESWILWLVVNLVSMYVYFNRGLYLTSVEYGAFFIMCIFGILAWRKDV